MHATAFNQNRAGGRQRVPCVATGPRSSSGQLTLGFECTVDPRSDAALRAAFRSLGVSSRVKYEDAIANAAWRICLRNLAEVVARNAAR